jgi:hypothetical protein
MWLPTPWADLAMDRYCGVCGEEIGAEMLHKALQGV